MARAALAATAAITVIARTAGHGAGAGLFAATALAGSNRALFRVVDFAATLRPLRLFGRRDAGLAATRRTAPRLVAGATRGGDPANGGGPLAATFIRTHATITTSPARRLRAAFRQRRRGQQAQQRGHHESQCSHIQVPLVSDTNFSPTSPKLAAERRTTRLVHRVALRGWTMGTAGRDKSIPRRANAHIMPQLKLKPGPQRQRNKFLRGAAKRHGPSRQSSVPRWKDHFSQAPS